MNNSYLIYSLTNTITRKRYIGLTSDLVKRRSEHLTFLRHKKHINKKLQTAFSQFGEHNFQWEILESNLSEENAPFREQFWIAHYNSLRHGYNMSALRYKRCRSDVETEIEDTATYGAIHVPIEFRNELSALAEKHGFRASVYSAKRTSQSYSLMRFLETVVKEWVALKEKDDENE